MIKINIVKMKTKWERRFFFRKNLRVQFDVVFDSESNGGFFDSLRYEDLRIKNLCNTYNLRKIIFCDFFVSMASIKNFTCAEPILIDFHYYIDLE